jgi:membrane protease YdiL (CAAX protease family)
MFPEALELLGAALLLFGVPALSLATMRRPELFSIPRMELYYSAVLSSLLLATLIVGVEIILYGTVWGLAPLPTPVLARWTALLMGIALVAMGAEVILENAGVWPGESRWVRLLMPETRGEKLWSVLVLAPTAALCEEVVYRGFLLAVLCLLFHSTGWAIAVSSIAFGLAHPYQGWRGMARASLMGTLLAWPLVSTGSLFPSIATHFLIDALSLGWIGPATLRRESLSSGG